jgi:pyruvate dehydrogenase (quinone)/pyruvate decarboxylase
VDVRPDRIGLRYPVELGLVGDVRETLRALMPKLHRKGDRSWLALNQQRMAQWNQLIQTIEQDRREPMRPQGVVRIFGDLIDPDAIISLDCGGNTHFAGRHLRAKATQKLALSGMLASMAPGLPFAIAAKLAFPERQSVAVVGDGGFAMLMAEFSTAVRLKLPIKILLLKNNVLGEVQFEQCDLGFPSFGCELGDIDFQQFAKACGGDGFKCTSREQLIPTIRTALASPNAALIEVWVDPEEAPLTPEKLRAANA